MADISEKRLAALDSIVELLVQYRTEAINGRRLSGIETEWREDEEYYEAIEEQKPDSWEEKPIGQAPVYTDEEYSGSNVFLNIVRPYCDVVAARMGDMLFPTSGDRPFRLSPTSLPDLIKLSEGEVPDYISEQVDAEADDIQQAEQTKQKIISQAQQEIEIATKRAKKAEDQIADHLEECQFQAQARRILEDSSKAGSGVLKGPFPVRKKTIAYIDGEIVPKEKVVPASQYVDYWNFFPDPACGENIHRGSYCWERDYLTEKELYGLRGGQYFDDQIERVLEEGPHEASYHQAEGSGLYQKYLKQSRGRRLYEVWYFYGMLSPRDMESLDLSHKGRPEMVAITMINNRPIKAALHHLDTDEFPYDLLVYQRRKGSCWGIGVARQIRVAQRIVNAGTRQLMDNAGIAGGPMLAVNSQIVEPEDGIWEVKPHKLWVAAKGADFQDMSRAIQFLGTPIMQNELQAIIQFALKMAEDITGLPFMLQGQQGAAPDTVGGMILMQNNASTVLRRIVRTFDDMVTEPHIRRYYIYLLQYGENDEVKGDMQINARGSSALVERDLQSQAIIQLGQFVQNPIFGKDPRKWMDEMLKSQKLDPNTLDYDDEEWQQIVEGMGQPPVDQGAQIALAKIELDREKLQVMSKLKEAELELRAVMAQQRNEWEVFFKQIDMENDMRKDSEQKELTLAEMQVRYRQHQEQIDAKLAETMMRLDVQQMLSQEKSAPSTQQVLIPPTEPAGRAPAGQAYQK